MAILVDDARWAWRGARWAHLVSDESHDELHEFALAIGKRRLGFQGDHYDVDEVDQVRAVEHGAHLVDSRTLVRRLRAAGLRVRDGKPRWVRLAAWPAGDVPNAIPTDIDAALAAVDVDLAAATVALFEDPMQRALLIDVPPDLPVEVAPHPAALMGGHRVDGWRSVEIFVSR